MNEQQKLVSINQELKDFITNINWEDRQFTASLCIFESMLQNVKVTDIRNNINFVGTLAKAAIEAAKVFVDKYKDITFNE